MIPIIIFNNQSKSQWRYSIKILFVHKNASKWIIWVLDCLIFQIFWNLINQMITWFIEILNSMLRVKNIKTHEEIKTKNRCVYVFGQKPVLSNSIRAVYFITIVKWQCTQTLKQCIILSQAVFKSLKLLLQSFEPTPIKATVYGR